MRHSLNYLQFIGPRRSETGLKQLRADLYPSGEENLPLEELNRLFDMETEPKREDYKAALKQSPHLGPKLSQWVSARLSTSQWMAWTAEDTREALEEWPARSADSKFRLAQLRNQLASGTSLKSNQADEAETKTAIVTPENFGVDDEKLSYNGKEVVEVATRYAKRAGVTRGVSRTRILERLASFDEDKYGDRRNQIYNLSPGDVIEFLSAVFRR